jgi:N-acetylmuramoyl-L-alanine amidase
MKNIPTKLIVHHSAITRHADQLAEINQYHKSKEFPISSFGFYVGYHYLINHAGVITHTRADDEEGAHSKGINFESIGICLEGNFDEELPTEEQKSSLGKLLVGLCQKYKLDVTDIYPHRAFRDTACYGKKLDDSWARVLYLDYKPNNQTFTVTCTAH